MVTGKNKEQFEKWFKRDFKGWVDNEIGNACADSDLEDFYDLPLSMQWGVYLEYYDSVDICIEIPSWSQTGGYSYGVRIAKEPYSLEIIKNSWGTRREAQIEALKKADEIVNKRLND